MVNPGKWIFVQAVDFEVTHPDVDFEVTHPDCRVASKS